MLLPATRISMPIQVVMTTLISLYFIIETTLTLYRRRGNVNESKKFEISLARQISHLVSSFSKNELIGPTVCLRGTAIVALWRHTFSWRHRRSWASAARFDHVHPNDEENVHGGVRQWERLCEDWIMQLYIMALLASDKIFAHSKKFTQSRCFLTFVHLFGAGFELGQHLMWIIGKVCHAIHSQPHSQLLHTALDEQRNQRPLTCV